jgi:hypothetical protein
VQHEREMVGFLAQDLDRALVPDDHGAAPANLVLANRQVDDPVDVPLSLKCHTSAHVLSTSPVPPVERRSVASVRGRLVIVAAEERSGRRGSRTLLGRDGAVS